MLTKSSIIPLQMINFIFTLFILLLQSSSIKNLDLLDNRHNASCYQDSECPSRMHCKLSEDEINLCICESGYTYSHPFARCEPSKRIFHDFRINGPTIINLPKKEVKYEVNFFKSDDQNKGNWQYEWLIQDGHEFANFCGLNTSTLKLFNLTTGFILFGISISNESAYGYIPHNLTILSPNQTKQNEHPTINGRPIVIAENLTVYLPTKYAILSGIKSKNANKFKWTPSDNFPIKMIVGSNLNMPELFLTNLISGQYYFNLTVKNDEFEDNKIVGLNILNGFDELNSIEITLMNQEKIIDFTYVKQEKLSTAIEDILTGHFGHEIIIQFNEIEFNEKEQQILLIFHAFMKDLAAKKDLLDVNKMIDILNGNSTFKRSFDILEIKTHFCTLSCGHGICNNFTKKCICDDFWMQNIFNGKQDCTWPIIALWIFALFILMIIAKIVHILWMNEEQNAVKASQLVKNLIGQQNGRKHLAGRLSPIKQFKKGKAWNNSVKGILQNFENSHQNRSSTNRRQILPKMNEESDCYDEEEDEESSSSFSDE